MVEARVRADPVVVRVEVGVVAHVAVDRGLVGDVRRLVGEDGLLEAAEDRVQLHLGRHRPRHVRPRGRRHHRARRHHQELRCPRQRIRFPGLEVVEHLPAEAAAGIPEEHEARGAP